MRSRDIARAARVPARRPRLWLALCATVPSLIGVPASAQDAAPAGGAQPSAAGGTSQSDILVIGHRTDGSFPGVPPGDELNEEDIDAVGVDKVADLLAELLPQSDERNTPLILINGEPAGSVADVADLPVEAVSKVQLLPRQAAVQLGQPQTRRVINVVVKRDFRQEVGLLQGDVATAGGDASGQGEFTYTRALNGNRVNFSARVRGEGMLLESERGLISASGSLPFATDGNVLASPPDGSEIDPMLSALVGHPVTVVGAPPGETSPTLAEFAAIGEAHPIDDTQFRSLLPRVRSLSLNGTVYRRFSPQTTLLLSGQLAHSETEALTGVTDASLELPETSPFSPFSQPVTVARFLGDPLGQNYHATSSNLGATFNTAAGKWRLTFNASWAHAESRTLTERSFDLTRLEDAVAQGSASPFGPTDPALLGSPPTETSKGRADSLRAQLNASGPLFDLPAGPVIGSALVSTLIDRATTNSIFGGFASTFNTHRTEVDGQAGLQIPLNAGNENGDGSLSGSVAMMARHLPYAGTYLGFSSGLQWSPVQNIVLEATADEERTAPQLRTLTDPVVVREGVRVFDFVRGETVDVSYVTGGNPDIGAARRKTLTLGGEWNPIPNGGLTLQAEYVRSRVHNQESVLPPASAEVQIAYPDRYLRDATGRLIRVDARAVAFESADRDSLHWSISFKRHLGSTNSPKRGSADAADSDDSAAPETNLRTLATGWRLKGTLTHDWLLRATRRARTGLPAVDLLEGGAYGYGSGVPRHVVSADMILSGHGVGAEAQASWTSKSEIDAAPVASASDLRFAPRTVLDMRVYANLSQVIPGVGPVLKGARLSFEANNVFDSKVRVANRAGITPLAYQAYYLDPRGRTFMVSLRKVF